MTTTEILGELEKIVGELKFVEGVATGEGDFDYGRGLSVGRHKVERLAKQIIEAADTVIVTDREGRTHVLPNDNKAHKLPNAVATPVDTG